MRVKMVRKLTNKETPDVVCESSFLYRLPQDLIDLVNDADEENEIYAEYCFVEINKHLTSEFAGAGFFPERLVDCE